MTRHAKPPRLTRRLSPRIPSTFFAVEETGEEDDSSSSSEEAPAPYAAGSAAYSGSQRRLGTIVGLSTAPAPPQSLMAAARRRAETDVVDLEAETAPMDLT